jgi:hypothetical protein
VPPRGCSTADRMWGKYSLLTDKEVKKDKNTWGRKRILAETVTFDRPGREGSNTLAQGLAKTHWNRKRGGDGEYTVANHLVYSFTVGAARLKMADAGSCGGWGSTGNLKVASHLSSHQCDGGGTVNSSTWQPSVQRKVHALRPSRTRRGARRRSRSPRAHRYQHRKITLQHNSLYQRQVLY